MGPFSFTISSLLLSSRRSPGPLPPKPRSTAKLQDIQKGSLMDVLFQEDGKIRATQAKLQATNTYQVKTTKSIQTTRLISEYQDHKSYSQLVSTQPAKALRFHVGRMWAVCDCRRPTCGPHGITRLLLDGYKFSCLCM